MELKFIDNPVRLQAFLNDPGNTENIVEPGHTYYIKPDAVYLGIYEGLVLAGVHEVRNFWHSIVECHAVYDPGLSIVTIWLWAVSKSEVSMLVSTKTLFTKKVTTGTGHFEL